jgi:hypothetical protein
VNGAVYGFVVEDDGTLTPVPGSPFYAGPIPEPVAVSPDGRYVAVANGTLDPVEELHVFHVEGDGSLTPLAGSPVLVPDDPLGLAIVPKEGRTFVYVPSAPLGQITGLEIVGEDLVEISGSPWTTPQDFPVELIATADAAYLYATLVGGWVAGWAIAADGSLSPLPGSPYAVPASNVFYPSLSPDGLHLYVGTGLDNAVAGFAIQPDGSLVDLPGSPYPSGGESAVSVPVDPSGDWVFVVHVVSETVTTMRRFPDGYLELADVPPFSVGAMGAQKGISDGRYLFVTDDLAAIDGINGVFSLAIGEDGFLDPVPGSPFDAGGRPRHLALYRPPGASEVASREAAGTPRLRVVGPPGRQRILLEVPRAMPLRVVLYDVMGRRVGVLWEGVAATGRGPLRLAPPPGLPSGIYWVRCGGSGWEAARKAVLVK